MYIQGRTLVDGGVADNTPALPLLSEGIEELWIVSLQREKIDLKEHVRRVLIQTLFADGPTKTPGKAFAALEEILRNVRVVVVAPQVSLGGLLTGTLNFNRKRMRAYLRHGYRVATSALSGNIVRPIKPPQFTLQTRQRGRNASSIPPDRFGRQLRGPVSCAEWDSVCSIQTRDEFSEGQTG
jgi:hypothetical protein